MDIKFVNQIFIGNPIKSYLLFFGILIVGLLFKKISSKIISKLLFTFFKKFSTEIKIDKFLELLIKPIESLVTIVIIYIAINQLDYPLDVVVFKRIVNKIPYTITIIQVLDKIFLFLIISSAFRILLRSIDFVSHVFAYKASLTESKTDDQMVPFLRELSKIIVIVLGVFVVMGVVFNMNVATIIAGLGIGGLAIALAAQDTLQNLLGSFAIFADKPFVVGDLVRVEGFEGVIEKVGFRSTILRTLDKTLVVIPNKKMIDSPLENLTLRNLRRVKFIVNVLYNTPPATIKKISDEIAEFINQHEHTNADTLVTFDAFGESALNIQVLYFIEIVEYNVYMKIKEEFNFKVMEIVYRNGAEFAFPSRTVYHENKGISEGFSE
jgi:MscS family membrane protein